ncbi:hypothetical protein MMC06_002811 [Schaereria dolodes]|nr:hypothetical protein [Schaereria dolodes]
MGAGTLTTAHILAITTFHILASPSTLTRLMAELRADIPDPSITPKCQMLEQLQYLSAVIIEGLRIRYGIPGRLQRIYPEPKLQFNKWIIPSGTPLGMSNALINEDPSIFHKPGEFLPDRWITSPYIFNEATGGQPKDIN